MKPKDIKTFVSLVEEIKKEGLTMPNMPLPIWDAVHSLLSLPAVEVIMTRTGQDFLLTYRNDEHFKAWQIPGGFVGFRESLAEACVRVAKREVGLTPKFKKVITAEVWKDHPYSSGPLSIVCLCAVRGVPLDGRFFTKIPAAMVPHQAGFLQTFLDLSLKW